MKMELPTPVLHSLFALNAAGYESYVVGGCVRDALMGKEPFDWDITTSALPEQTMEVFQDCRTIETGIQHGTVTVIIDEMPLEITTYRVDGDYSDGRHPDRVSFTRSLTEDLKRRDFTVNAIAYHPNVGLVDPFDGQKDLQNSIIRCVGDPSTRFSEDALRLLRGMRFAATLDFCIEETTATAIHQLAPTLSGISAERIAIELEKLLCGNNAPRILTEYTDVLEEILPCRLDSPNLAKRMALVKATPLSRYAALLFDTSEETVTAMANRLKFSRHFTEDLSALIRHKAIPISNERAALLRLLHHLGPVLSKTLLEIRAVYDAKDYTSLQKQLDDLVQRDACYRLSRLAISGNDLLDAGFSPGPAIGTTLQRLLEAVMDGDCANTKTDLLEYAKQKSLC